MIDVVSRRGTCRALTACCWPGAGRGAAVDRARFPRDKLCGDTLNPGALRVLARQVAIEPLATARCRDRRHARSPGRRACRMRGRYRGGPRRSRGDASRCSMRGCWISAVGAGVASSDGVTVTRPVVDGTSPSRGGGRRQHPSVDGAEMHPRAAGDRVPTAGGPRWRRRSALAQQPRWPRRWAVGAYFEVGRRPPTLRRDARPARTLHRRRAGAGRPRQRLSRRSARS